MIATQHLSAAQWEQYDRDGYLHLGKLLSDADLATLCQRIDDIMLGRAALDYGRMLMQLDSETGRYEDAGEQSKGHKGSTLNYRKIQDLEHDDIHLAFMQRQLFREICAWHYGVPTPIACFRAMFFNKPAGKGTYLPWHQDRWTALDRDPLVTIWTALDPATAANGCVQIIPGSHRKGLINPSHPSGFLTEAQATEHCPEGRIVHLELKAGEVALLHNWLLHRSGINASPISRRGFSVCYMDARTKDSGGHQYPVVFGPEALTVESIKGDAVGAAG